MLMSCHCIFSHCQICFVRIRAGWRPSPASVASLPTCSHRSCQMLLSCFKQTQCSLRSCLGPSWMMPRRLRCEQCGSHRRRWLHQRQLRPHHLQMLWWHLLMHQPGHQRQLSHLQQQPLPRHPWELVALQQLALPQPQPLWRMSHHLWWHHLWCLSLLWHDHLWRLSHHLWWHHLWCLSLLLHLSMKLALLHLSMKLALSLQLMCQNASFATMLCMGTGTRWRRCRVRTSSTKIASTDGEVHRLFRGRGIIALTAVSGP